LIFSALRYILLSLLFLLSSVFGAEVGEDILNTATLSYTIGGYEKNQTTNEVNLTIAQTEANISYWKLSNDDASVKEVLESTKFLNADGVWESMPEAESADAKKIKLPSSVEIEQTDRYFAQDLVIIRLDDMDQNTHANMQDSVEVNVTNIRTGEVEVLLLRETALNSGIFIGYTLTTPCQSSVQQKSDGFQLDGMMCVATGDQLDVIYVDNGTKEVVSAEAKIVSLAYMLLVTKKQSKDVASIGEFVKYTVTVENVSQVQLDDVTMVDRLPPGVKYQTESFKVKDKSYLPTFSKDGKEISYRIETLDAGERVEMSYVALIGAGSIDHKVVNRAWAFSPIGARSNVAVTTLKLKEELYRSKGFIVGRVSDVNLPCDAKDPQKEHNATVAKSKVASIDPEHEDKKGCGVAGVKLYMEDGRYVVTDKEGRFHFVDVANGTHVVQVDEYSIRGRYHLTRCRQNTRFAESNRSQFVTLYHGELVRADFCLEREPDVTGSATLHIAIAKQNHDEIVLRLHVEKDLDLINPEVYLKLPDGLHYMKGSISNHIEPVQKGNIMAVSLEGASTVTLRFKNKPYGGVVKEIEGIFYFDTAVSQDEHSEMASVAFSSPDENLSNIASIVKPETEVKVVSVGGKLNPEEGDYNWTKATHQTHMPTYTPEQIDEMGDEPRIVWPPKGWIPDIPSTRVAILYPRGTHVELRLNGNKVNPLNYEGIFRGKSRQMYIMHFKGVDLRQGENRFEAIVSKEGHVIKRLVRNIYVENRAPESIEFVPEYSYLVADGKHPPVIAVRMLGASGHPLRSGLTGSFTTDAQHRPHEMSNGKGLFRVDSEGIAYIELEPTTITGETELCFRLYSGREKCIQVRLKPHMREWILVGFAEGTVGYNTLRGHQESLDERGAKEKWYKDGRVAFFAKGRIKGEWLLTMAYDSGRGKDDRELFDKIDADAYYTLFSDATRQSSEAPSRKKLYVKLEKEDFSLLFGDFSSGLTQTELSSYNRSFTGIKSVYHTKNVDATLFGAESDQLFYREDIRGDGTRGYYHLSHTPIIVGSEEITIEVRDRDRDEIVLSQRVLQRYSDYDIDYDKGTLYFKDVIYSKDEAFNPQYIVAKYEVDGSGEEHYTYGGRVSYKSDNEKVEVGATAIKEERGNGNNELVGVDLKVEVSDELTLVAEYAKSHNSEENSTVTGDAAKIELDYDGNQTDARIYYRKQDASFGLGQLADSLSSTRRMGIDINRRISEKWTLAAQLYQNRHDEEDGHTDLNVAYTGVTYKDKQWQGDIGYRYAKRTDKKATQQLSMRAERVLLDNNLSLWISHDQDIGGGSESYPMRTAIGVTYRCDANKTLFAQVERSDENGDIGWSARSGVEYKLWQDGKVRINRLYTNDESGSRVYDTLGIDRTLTFGEVWKWHIGYEKGMAWDNNQSSRNFDALSTAISYTTSRYSGEISFGYRVDDLQKRINIDTGLYVKQSKEVGLASALGYHRTWGEGREERDIDLRGSFVYRPLDGKWVVLDRLDLIETYRRGLTDEYKTQKVVNNMHLNWQYNPWWYFGLHYGLKHVIDTIDDEEYSSWTDLIGVNVRYDIKENWSVGLQGSLLHAYTANNLDFSGGVFVSMTPWQNAELTLGYNFAGFRDDDFNLQNYYIQGPYLRMRMKFDQESVKSMAEGVVQ